MKINNLKNQKSIVENSSKDKKLGNESFSYSVYNKNNFKKFCGLEEDKTVKVLLKNDLPSEFDAELCEFINLFRRKTINEKKEWEFYIDYENNEIIHCFYGESTEVNGWINTGLMENRTICSIHNHIKGTYSPPSAANFEILDNEFEKYEIICSDKEFWILEAKGIYEKEFIKNLKKEIKDEFNKCDLGIYQKNNSKEIYDSNEEYSKRLSELINNLNNNIVLKRMEYR